MPKKLRHCGPAGQLFLKLARAGGQLELPLAQWIPAAATLLALEGVWGLDTARLKLCGPLLARKLALAQECIQGRDGKPTNSDIVPPGWASEVFQTLCEGLPLGSFSEEDQNKYYLIIATRLVDMLTNPRSIPELMEFLCNFYFDRNHLVDLGYPVAILPQPIDLPVRKDPPKLNERHRSDILPVTNNTRVNWRLVSRHEIACREAHTLPNPKEYMTELRGKPLVGACYPKIDFGPDSSAAKTLRLLKARLYAGDKNLLGRKP